MESKASFQQRAQEIDLDSKLLTDLLAKQVNTFSKLAYICPANPNSGDDSKLKAAVEALVGYEVDAVKVIGVRQLWYEAYMVAMTELESRVKKTPMDTPKALPLAERLARIERQKQNLTGIVMGQYLEPAHALTDRISQMAEDNVLTHIPPERCISRHDEIQNQKSEQQVVFDAQGSLKINKRAVELSCDCTGELRLRQALTRKALAFDQAGLCCQPEGSESPTAGTQNWFSSGAVARLETASSLSGSASYFSSLWFSASTAAAGVESTCSVAIWRKLWGNG